MKSKNITIIAVLAIFLVPLLQSVPVFALDFSTEKITIPGTDRFGWTVKRTDFGVAVGEPFADSGSGKVHFFDSTGSITGEIENPNVGGSQDNFGYSLSSLGNILAVGAPGYDNDEGIVYLYDITNPSSPTLITPGITNPSNMNGERMGEDEMNFFGDDLLVGVSKAKNHGQIQAGVIHRFDTSGGLVLTYDDPNSIDPNNMFGRSISVDDSVFLSGAHGTDNEKGHASVLDSSSILFPNPDDHEGDKYGWSTEITPNRYLVSAINGEVSYSSDSLPPQTVQQGKVYLHHKTTSNTDVITSPDISDLDLSQDVTDNFGYDISESGGFIVVSAPFDDVSDSSTTHIDAGSVYLYTGSGYPLETMHNIEPQNNALFGHSIEIVDGLIVIGVPGDNNNQGAIYYLAVSNEFAATLMIDALPNPVLAGGTTTITYTIKNSGTADLFNAIVTIDTPTCSTFDGPFSIDEDEHLNSGEEWQFTCEVVVTAPFEESVVEATTEIAYLSDPNEESPTIKSCGDQNFECSDTESIEILGPSITLDVSADPTTIFTGETSIVTFKLTNDGNDLRYAFWEDIDVNCTPEFDTLGNPIEIVPTGSVDFTCEVTGADDTTLDIIATIITKDANNENPVTVSDTVTINVIVPSVTLDISADPDPTYDQEVTTITYTVTNSGNAPLTIDSQMDLIENSGACTPTTITALPVTLQPSEELIFTCTVTAGTSPINFDATITAADEHGDPVSASDTLILNVIAPTIDLAISSNPNPVNTGSNSLITYTVTNSGNAPLTIDSQMDLIENSGACTPTTITALPVTLQPSEELIFTCTVTAGTSPINFDAKITAADENERPVSASAQHTLDVIQNIVLSGIIRDFKIAHPDFEYKISDDDGIVKMTLGGDGEPLYSGNPFTGTITTTGLVNYNHWYNHVNTINDCTQYDITLSPTTSGTFKYMDSDFFPIDGQLFGNEGKPHNYHFTYQIHATFVYQTGQTIIMTGDDDIWVFIDNKLALDQGGVLPPRTGTINLDTLGLTPGTTYSFDLFFAERHTVQSNLGIETNIPLIQSTPAQCSAVDAVNDSVFAIQGPNTIPITNNDSGFSSISAFTQGLHGSVSQIGTSLVYTPALGFEGIDLFTYTIANTLGGTDTAVVTVIALTDATCPLPPDSYNMILGDNTNNKLRGTNNNDLILGLGGDDKIYGKGGNDCLVGGNGNDKIWGGDGNDTVLSGSGNDQIHGQNGDDTMFGGIGDDKIYGYKGNDVIDAGAGNDRVHANQDNDTVFGGDGNDWLGAGIGNDLVNGGIGDDKIFGRPGNDILNGDAGNDYIHAGQGDDTTNGGDDNDKIFGHQGVDILNGNNGNDYIHGGQGNDALDGGDGNDKCNGDQGSNTIVNCEVEDKKMKEDKEENDDDEGEKENDDDDDKDNKDK
ncbi:fibro-slime domain-containing protein [Candidatus Nitrosotenuis cloacae]|uniref:fibro-slime domain-containing protein n=1 Tax=Candidatus Nitrosotenuis cloacae TaxID=1603555 RepID=UPI00069B688C|nr:fibro-slime domain-containing protein [Candidatus Nitrosotenuis cloacae]